MQTDWTIDSILKACGGATRVAVALGLTESAVLKMRRNGIHDRHWSTLIAMGAGQFNALNVFAANEVARRETIGSSAGMGGAVSQMAIAAPRHPAAPEEKDSGQ